MGKPKYLYHGGRDQVEILVPKQAIGLGADADAQNAVYAVAIREWAIPFAITFVPTGENAKFSVNTESTPPRVRLRNTEVRWNAIGYLYTLPSHTFERIDEHQWVSYSSVKPILIEEVNPVDFRGWIEIEES